MIIIKTPKCHFSFFFNEIIYIYDVAIVLLPNRK
jgi:hypothetical protein